MFPIWGTLVAGTTKLHIEGSIADAANISGIDVMLQIEGQTMANLYPFLLLPLPASPPYKLRGNLKLKGDRYTMDNLAGKIGRNRYLRQGCLRRTQASPPVDCGTAQQVNENKRPRSAGWRENQRGHRQARNHAGRNQYATCCQGGRKGEGCRANFAGWQLRRQPAAGHRRGGHARRKETRGAHLAAVREPARISEAPRRLHEDRSARFRVRRGRHTRARHARCAAADAQIDSPGGFPAPAPGPASAGKTDDRESGGHGRSKIRHSRHG